MLGGPARRGTVLLAAMLAFWMLALAAEAQTITVRPNVKAGDTINLTLTKTLKRERPNQPRVDGSSETPITITVLEARSDGYVIRWMAGGTRILSTTEMVDPVSQQMIDLAQGVPFEIQLDGSGRFRQLRNYEQAKAQLERALSVVLETVQDEAQRNRLRDGVSRLFATRQALEQTALREAMVYLYPFGRTLQGGKPEVQKLAVRTPFDREPIPAVLTITLLSHEPSTGLARMKWSQELDPSAAAEAVRRMAEGVLRQSGKELPENARLPTLDVTDQGIAEIATGTGFAQSVEYERRVSLQDNLEHQTVKLVRTP
ncbi:MAG: hypothetical protein KIT81_03315 [Alphaproteobacteria bacterium]|nr:hypothetical protein [Alphaproteobacteria bacterium]